ncbi:hypothetical protein O181_095159 [Austropuccinia psidii MF-1]|uniref:Reverse transcriptase Ty1/copia-type domain-containing protein n=1 Tax=Austropuccinia psidii MF-1 TaxID=1389203 RepID=A0A9Q3J4S7_9BASI|nr:hypothetical protein [Austropuccinia psidii MF-1]
MISSLYTPQHNPFSKRGNCSVLEKARCILLHSKLPIKYWAEAVSTATFLCNLVPKHEDRKTPYESWHNTKPPLHRLKPFGCIAWLKVPTNYIKNNRHVVFDEENLPLLPSQQQFTEDVIKTFPFYTQTIEEEVQVYPNIEEGSSSNDLTSINNDNEDKYVDVLEHQPKRIQVISLRHPTLISSKIDSNNILPFPHRQARENLANLSQNQKTISKAMASPNKKEWNLEIKKELQNIESLKVRTLRDRKNNDHPITSTWIFKEKTDYSGKVTKYKACLCAHVFHQIAGLYYQKEICLEIPQGVSANKEAQVLQLNKALYGLKQALLAWYKHLSNWLITSDFQCSLTNPCVFWRKGKKLIWIYIHVDDLAIFGPDLNEFKKEIKSKFDMRDLGKANLLLGIKTNHFDDGFSLDQEHYIKKLANKYKIKDPVPSNTPLKPHLQLLNSSNKEHNDFNNLNINYQSAVGSLNYISSNTRPDITFAVSHLSQFLEKPGLQHWNTCCQVFQYFYHSKNICLTFRNHRFNHIKTYADADWGNCPID